MDEGSAIGFNSPTVAYEQLFAEYARVFQRQVDLTIADDLVRVARRVADAIGESQDLGSDAKLGLLTGGVAWGAQPALLIGLDPEDVSEMLVRDVRLVIEGASRGSDGTISLHEVISSAHAHWAELSLCGKLWGM